MLLCMNLGPGHLPGNLSIVRERGAVCEPQQWPGLYHLGRQLSQGLSQYSKVKAAQSS